MRTDDELRAIYAGYRCNSASLTTVLFPTGTASTIGLKVAPPTATAWKLFTERMSYVGYYFEELAGGSYNCRKIAGSNEWSLHSYGIAVDLNPSKNPRGLPLTTDIPASLYEWAEDCTTASGARVFSWGGRWGNPDPMHFQINASPNELAGGIKYPMTDEQMAELKAHIDAAAAEIVKQVNQTPQEVWQYKGQFDNDDPGDNAQRTLVRTETRTATILAVAEEILDNQTPLSEG